MVWFIGTHFKKVAIYSFRHFDPFFFQENFLENSYSFDPYIWPKNGQMSYFDLYFFGQNLGKGIVPAHPFVPMWRFKSTGGAEHP